MKLPFDEPSKPIINNAKMLKVYWDRNGFLLGIGQDFQIYQKKGIDWKVRPWELDSKIRGTSDGALTKVIDLTGFFNNILGGKTFGAAWATAFVLLHLSSVSEIFSTLLPANEGSGAKRNAAITVAVTTRFILTPTQSCQVVC